jgi:CO/xanthine dehydrogenase FAD-binding subunit
MRTIPAQKPRILSADETVVEKDGGLLVGIMATVETLQRHPLIREFPALDMALRGVATPNSQRLKDLRTVLNRETAFQGLAAALMVLDAKLVVSGPMGERMVGPGCYLSLEGMSLAPGEITTGFYLSEAGRHSSGYQSVGYLRSGQAVCGVAAWARKSGDTLEEVRVALSGCTPVPVSLNRVSAALTGKECTTRWIQEATLKLGEERLRLYNPSLILGSHLFNLAQTLIRRAILTL